MPQGDALVGLCCSLTQVAPGYFDITIHRKLPPTKLRLCNHLKPGPLEMKRLNASLWRRALIEEPVEDPAAGDPDSALVGAEDHGELNAVAVLIPARILWELEEQHACDLLGEGAECS
jgi:hypothetical protein